MSLTPELQALVEQHTQSGGSIATVGFGMCWPASSKIAVDINISLASGETVDDATERLDLSWNPTWLFDAGFVAVDAGDRTLGPGDPIATPGPISWSPEPNLPRLDDQTSDNATGFSRARRLAAEVAVTALWADQANIHGGVAFDPRPPESLSGNTRGARFKDFLVHVLGKALPAGWTVLPEVPLTRIRGLHMRKDVGQRKSDIAVLDDASRLVAVISSKWTWRSDRGTEAAQMVPLKMYRPDVPYALVTAEFPRVGTVARESIEDSAYHLVPTLAGAYRRIYDSTSPRIDWPTLDDVHRAGTAWAGVVGLRDITNLIEDLRNSGSIL